jgi:hypothetical protein
MTGTAPIGAGIDPDKHITATCTDDVQVVLNTVDVDVTEPTVPPTVHNAVINGAIQVGWQAASTITANAGNGYDIDLVPDDLMIIGAWSAFAYCEDAGAAPAQDTWNWTVAADAPTIDSQSPINIEADLQIVRVRLLDDWGWDTTTIDWTVTPAAGRAFNIVTAGAIKAPFAGSIIKLNDIGNGPREVTILIRTWPETVPQGKRLTFALDADTVVGTSL